MANSTVLSLQGVTIRYGDHVAVDALSLHVTRGEIFGLLGPNGSGKSSTLSAILGAVAPTTGSIRVRGRSEADDPLTYRRHIGLVPQELALFEDLSARANLLFFGRLYGLSGPDLRRRVAEALELVRLTEQADRPARTYSGGMQRRLNLACALLHDPDLLLLDEPTVGLDIQSRDTIFAGLRALRKAGRALVFTTHHLAEAELLCDRLGIMDHGRLLAVGTLEELCAGRLRGSTRGWSLRADGPEPLSGAHGARLEQVFLQLTGRSPCEP
jgi:ABC-2 type transport system ATP-binding protein